MQGGELGMTRLSVKLLKSYLSDTTVTLIHIVAGKLKCVLRNRNASTQSSGFISSVLGIKRSHSPLNLASRYHHPLQVHQHELLLVPVAPLTQANLKTGTLQVLLSGAMELYHSKHIVNSQDTLRGYIY